MNIPILIINFILALLLAPMLDGLRRKFTARLQNRVGPPILQSWYDIIKLLRKETLIPGISGLLVLFIPIIALTFSFSMFFMISTIAPEAPIKGNAILFIHLSVLSAFLLALTGSVSRNPYGIVGGSREIILVTFVEPALIISLIALMLSRESLYLSEVYTNIEKGLPIFITMISYFLCLIAESGKIPFDLGEAESELTGGPIIEFGGKLLAFIKLSQLLRTLALFSLTKFFIGALIPISPKINGYSLYIIILYFVSLVLCTFIISISESLNARFRLFEASKFFGFVLAVSIIALLLSISYQTVL